MRVGLLLALVAAASPAAAQQDFSKVEFRVEKLGLGIAVLSGAGGNVALSHGKDGNVLVDDEYAPLSDKLAAAVRTVDRDPVRFVVNTHWHGDHTGGNDALGKLGAVIVAHDNVRQRMSSGQVIQAFNMKVPASPKHALPVVTFADGATLHLNGDTLHLVHVANAHTDGDVLVHWAKADVLHMGDTFLHQAMMPFIDTSSGGSIDGLVAAADKGLELAGPDTKIIPGHGPMAKRADLVAYRDMLVDVRARVAAGIAAGRTLAEIQADKPAARYGMTDGFIKPAVFVEGVYTSLKSPPGSAAHKH